MIETLIGGAMGGIARLVPEVMKWLDKKDERKHEVRMLEKQIEADKLQHEMRIAEVKTEGNFNLDLESMKALVAGIQGQGTPTGIKWVDALSSSVRPIVTYLVFSLYAWAKMTGTVITPEDNAIFWAVFNFWFMGRVFEKYRQ
jgi:hypothetical protein